MLRTPVLLLAFSRPDLTKKVFARIREMQPERFYMAVDGPRADRADDVSKCATTRAIADQVDWPCQVRTLFRDRNLGCRVGVSTAIDWFFEHEPEGIVLEDDCLASPAFFDYCTELLQLYREDERVMVISGDNFQRGRVVTPYSYYFSRYNHCWGWATWRRAWQHYDRDMSLWPAFKAAGGLKAWSDGSGPFEKHWSGILSRAAAGEIDSWAYRWTFSCWAHGGLTCLPSQNLVSNIGFDARATHTTASGSWQAGLRAEKLEFPLRHPRMVVRSVAADRYSDRVCFGIHRIRIPGRGFAARLGRKIRGVLGNVPGLSQ